MDTVAPSMTSAVSAAAVAASGYSPLSSFFLGTLVLFALTAYLGQVRIWLEYDPLIL